MRFWTTRGGQRSWKRDEETRLMRELASRFGRRVIHVFDRGFVGELWVRVCVVATNVRAMLRWKGQVHLLDEKGNCRAAWKAVVGKRQGQEQRVFWDARGHRLLRLRVAWAKVWHPSHPSHPLTLVVVRGYAQPWYLLTTEAISTEEEAWQIALAYLQRWQIEQVWRLDKSEFGADQCAYLGMGGPAQALKHGDAGSCVPAAVAGCQSGARTAAPVALAARLSPCRLAWSAHPLALVPLACRPL